LTIPTFSAAGIFHVVESPRGTILKLKYDARWDVSFHPGVVLSCRAIGVMQVEQNRTNNDPSARIRNDRILAVPEAAS
jgi:hypothetical protein